MKKKKEAMSRISENKLDSTSKGLKAMKIKGICMQ
jgi:hypothetical protein